MSSQEAFQEEAQALRASRQRTRAKRGELLPYRPRPLLSETPPESCPRELVVAIRYGGREFFATPAMAECFLANARRVLEVEGAELVALLHKEGLEMLFIAPNIPFRVGTVFEHHVRVTSNAERHLS